MDKYIVCKIKEKTKIDKMNAKIDKVVNDIIKKTKEYNVFTDGSCLNNDRDAENSSGGIGVFWEDDSPLNLSEPFNILPITNNRAELYAIIRAIQIFKIRKFKKKYKYILNIYTDSQLTISIMNKWIHSWKINNWLKSDKKEPLNLDLIIQLDNLINECQKLFTIKFIHVKAHRKKPKDKHSHSYFLWYGNYNADKLARLSSEKF